MDRFVPIGCPEEPGAGAGFPFEEDSRQTGAREKEPEHPTFSKPVQTDKWPAGTRPAYGNGPEIPPRQCADARTPGRKPDATPVEQPPADIVILFSDEPPGP